MLTNADRVIASKSSHGSSQLVQIQAINQINQALSRIQHCLHPAVSMLHH